MRRVPCSEELGAPPLVEEFGPHQLLVPTPPAEGSDATGIRAREPHGEAVAQRRATVGGAGADQPPRARGFTALEERRIRCFLTQSSQDCKRAPSADLLDIICEVTSGFSGRPPRWATMSVQFSRRGRWLFPGGEGRLILTDPDNTLTPPDSTSRRGRRAVKRLSLLSGGERSLAAVVLSSTARPAICHILDELEAVDDANLGLADEGCATQHPQKRHHGDGRRALRRGPTTRHDGDHYVVQRLLQVAAERARPGYTARRGDRRGPVLGAGRRAAQAVAAGASGGGGAGPRPRGEGRQRP